MVQTSTKVAILEDDRHTRERLGDAIGQAPAFTLAGSWGTLAEARAGWHTTGAQVLLVDLDLPDGSGVELIREVATAAPEVRIMVISVFGDERHVISAIEAGASGYLLKDADDEQIADAIDQLLAGGSPITPSVAVYLLKRFRPQGNKPPDHEQLTAREQDVLQLIAKGLSYSEVAQTLDVSINTVRAHIKHLFRKLAVSSRGEAVFEALDRGLLKLGR